MINKFKLRSEFSRNVLTLMTGTTIAQAIPIAISPILTRIYTPEDFGVFALYMSVTSMVAVIASGRYELAIMLPQKDEDAMNVMILSILIAVFISIVTLIIIFIFNSQIIFLLGNPSASKWLYFIPLTVLLTGVYQSLNYWFNRNRKYKTLAKNKIIQSGLVSSSNLSFGFTGYGASGLIFSSILGQSIATALLVYQSQKKNQNFLQSIQKLKILALAKRYSQFPKLDVPASLISVFSNQIPNILLNVLFSSTIAGYYYLTQRILSLPLTFISTAVANVFHEEASRSFKKEKNASVIYQKTFKKLFLIGFLPSIILYIFAQDIFIFVFGKEWAISGDYVKILVPMFFVKFIAKPLSFMLYIGEKQKLNLYSQMLFVIAILFAFVMGESAYDVLKYINILFSLIYLYYLYISAKVAKVF